MHVSCSHRRIALIVALALLGLAWPASATQTVKFQASGTFARQSVQGSNIVVANTGVASPGGKFSGTFVGRETPGNGVRGVCTWNFGPSDSVTFDQVMQFNQTTRRYEGTYVITGGTGKFAGASGSGVFLSVPAGNGTGTIEVAGTISK